MLKDPYFPTHAQFPSDSGELSVSNFVKGCVCVLGGGVFFTSRLPPRSIFLPESILCMSVYQQVALALGL